MVELNYPEVPIMDGSAAPFVYLIHEAGVRDARASRGASCASRGRSNWPAATSGSRSIRATHFKVTYSISYDHPLLRHQARTMTINEAAFVEQIAPARTFTFLKEVELLRQHGFALGGSLENAVVIGDTGVLNHPLRFEDEFVRHKILDAIGDLALVGLPVIGHLVAHRGGHGLHTAFVAKILEERDAWELVEAQAIPVPACAPLGAAVPAGR